MAETAENPVPLGPPELCFDCRAFTKEHFSVDEFLQEHRNRAKLETMRDDLGAYLKLLRSAMIDLINKDYGDFVDLSSNLIGLDKAIARIQAPLGQLREELLQVRQSIDGAMQEISVQLSIRHELRERKRSLRSLCRVQASLKKLKGGLTADDVVVGSRQQSTAWLERAAAEFSQLDYHVRRCSRDMTAEDSRDFEETSKQLTVSVDKLFIESLSKGEDGKAGILQCLSLYHTLDKITLAEQSYRRAIVAQAMDRLITESNLKSFPQGLTSMFEKIVEFVDRDMRLLLDVTEAFNARSGSHFNFFLNSFWTEVEEKLQTNLSSIFAAGEPESFFKRYTETLKFLEHLGQRCQPKDLDLFFKHQSFINFMDKWNLPVYFLLRFQEMAKSIENGFNDMSGGAGEWKLAATRVLWVNLLRCWADDVFLLPIAHKFWKFSLQILSRYLNWCKTVTKGKTDIQKLVYLHWDVTHLVEKIPEFKAVALAKLPKLNDQTDLLLKSCLEESSSELRQQLNEISLEIVRLLSNELTVPLRQVNDIPRLYRRTNRDSPTRPCPYVSTLLEPVTKFHETNQNHPNAQKWLQSIFGIVTKKYYASVDDVLNSVQKTEESLRRLKKARDRSSALTAGNDRRVDDDNKIRHQLLLDVHAFAQGIEHLGLTSASIEQLRDLLLLVEASQKT